MKKLFIVLLAVVLGSGCTSASRAAWNDPSSWEKAAHITTTTLDSVEGDQVEYIQPIQNNNSLSDADRQFIQQMRHDAASSNRQLGSGSSFSDFY